MRILVTGGNGFIGSRIAAHLAGNGHDVVATWHARKDRLPQNDLDGLTFEPLDITDRNSVHAMIGVGNFGAIVHTAALIDREDRLDALPHLIGSNVGSVGYIVEAAGRGSCPRIVFTSSIGVYGSGNSPDDGFSENSVAPDTLYGWSKRTAEEILDLATARAPEISAVSLRLAGVHGIGRNSGALFNFAQAAMHDRAISIAEPTSRFRWLFIDDALQCVDRALMTELSAGHHIVNVASADSYTLLETAERIRDIAGSQCAIEATAEARKRCSVLNIDKARQLLNFKPTTLHRFLPPYISDLRDK